MVSCLLRDLAAILSISSDNAVTSLMICAKLLSNKGPLKTREIEISSENKNQSSKRSKEQEEKNLSKRNQRSKE